MEKIITFIKSSGIYFIGSVLNKIAIVLLLPLYTNKINPADYGYYDLTMTYIALITSIFFIDIWTITMREMLGAESEKEKEKYLTNGIFIFLGCVITYTILIILFQQFINIKHIFLVYMCGLSTCLQSLYSSCIRGFNLNRIYVLSGVINTLIMLILNLIFLNILNYGYTSLYISAILGNIVQIIIIEINGKILGKIKYNNFNKTIIKKMFFISLPLCLNSAFYWILFNYNRILISYRLGTYENGLYAVGTKFSSVLSLITTCFSLAWQEVAFKNSEENNHLYSKASYLYINMLLIGVVVSLPLINIIFPLMIGVEYDAAKYIVPWSILASVMSIFNVFLGTIFNAIRDNKSIIIATLLGCIVNVVLVHLLITKIGVNAASIAIFFGFFVNVIIRIKILKNKIQFNINIFKLLKYIPIIGSVSYIYINFGFTINVITMLLSIGIITYINKKYIVIIYQKVSNKILLK
ncbi:lipopolysaccharide biosynthesis protein [Clostridium perfringens]|uniref:lipopolysaccharide biosynthesis protein n=1 Tax=Clostridium perfringens TaxID=1502 RepID=UPI0018E4D533|nr:oligosaccharide flippase family protein [Clostridium perfringens]MBI5997588.1 oligosaccharide flippase family protein [Clostridium perfringens]